jgi:hypothetical protein
MHDVEMRRIAVEMLGHGVSRSDVCRILRVGYNSTYRWQRRLAPSPKASGMIWCFRCADLAPPSADRYLYLLGQYLGDGHITRLGRSHALSIYCASRYPAILREVETAMRSVLTASICHRNRQGACVAVQSTTRHWLCVLPQHGPGRKHERPIVLTAWQRDLVAADPRPLIRGLLHSDGCRATNVVTRRFAGRTETYRYPRYFFSNMSADILTIFTDALDLLGIAWKRNRVDSVSIARREAVAALDGFVGPKS